MADRSQNSNHGRVRRAEFDVRVVRLDTHPLAPVASVPVAPSSASMGRVMKRGKVIRQRRDVASPRDASVEGVSDGAGGVSDTAGGGPVSGRLSSVMVIDVLQDEANYLVRFQPHHTNISLQGTGGMTNN